MFWGVLGGLVCVESEMKKICKVSKKSYVKLVVLCFLCHRRSAQKYVGVVRVVANLVLISVQ
jgi:hypothetical protein